MSPDVAPLAPEDLAAPLVIGFGVANQAAVRALVANGHRPTVVEDRPSETHRDLAVELGVELVEQPRPDALTELVCAASVLLPSPGVPDHHPAFAAAAAAGVGIISEFDLAQTWDRRPVTAITGTNGKTTVTMMVADALGRSGVAAAAVGNTDVPFVEAIADSGTEVFVVEASSFRLAHSRRFRPAVAAWLNFAPDHLDAHATLEDYEEAKASIWAELTTGATVVANADDPVVMRHVPGDTAAGHTLWTFSIGDGVEATWSVTEVDGAPWLAGPDGPFIAVDRLRRSQPHDLANALATAALVVASGGSLDGVVATLRSFEGLPHRLQYLGSRDEVAWYNDSKATVPHATVAAVGGFDSVVLIAGGYDKGLSFEPLRSTIPPVRAVVAIGDAADKIEAVYRDRVPVSRASTMDEAISEADRLAAAGDAVLLSPACASFDWYPNYVTRGLDFIERVESGVLLS
ncbi:MAG: UDP-N-acetylmuramoyl-L-alanine--D-glutamate ligase [Actinomycetota bacterium]